MNNLSINVYSNQKKIILPAYLSKIISSIAINWLMIPCENVNDYDEDSDYEIDLWNEKMQNYISL